MSSEQERPVLPNSTPTGCQITSVIAWAVTLLQASQGKTPSHHLAILEMADFCHNPFLGDLFLTEVARGKPPACKSPASQSRPPLVCCSCWVGTGDAAKQQLSSAPPRPLHEAGSDIRGGGFFWGMLCACWKQGGEQLLQLVAKVSV